MPRWLKTSLHLVPIVIGVAAASVIGLLAFRSVVSPDQLQASSDAVGNYLQTVGGIYAVLLAFVVYVVWGQFNDARACVEREASSVVDLHRTASGLPPATRSEIQRHLRAYIDAVLADEWPAMAEGNEATIERVGAKLDDVWVEIHRCEPSNDCQHVVYAEVLSRFNELSDLRTNRLTASRARIPLAMRILLNTGAVITIASMYLMSVPQLWIHVTVTAALAGAIAHVLFLIHDLDDAFAGDWQVAKAPFLRARRSLERVTYQVDVDPAA
ncbi:MAG TPA: DUF4239 domain-containing protein [Kofleriaceae bacterium]|nr:DUF4239 domain-containing protein [Kofleriaceae bacterium]